MNTAANPATVTDAANLTTAPAATDLATVAAATSLAAIDTFIERRRDATIDVAHPHALLYYMHAVCAACRRQGKRVVFVCKDDLTARIYARHLDLLRMPNRYLPPREFASIEDGLSAERIQAWYGFCLAARASNIDSGSADSASASTDNDIRALPPALLCTAESFCAPVARGDVVRARTAVLTRGKRYVREALYRLLVTMGYRRVSEANTAGEYAVRGEIIDLFPAYYDAPLRIRTEFDTVVDIRRLDADDKDADIAQITALPLHEWPAGKADAPIDTDSSPSATDAHAPADTHALANDTPALTDATTMPYASLTADDALCILGDTVMEALHRARPRVLNSDGESSDRHDADDDTCLAHRPTILKQSAAHTLMFRRAKDGTPATKPTATTPPDKLATPPKPHLANQTDHSATIDIAPAPKYYNNLQLAHDDCRQYADRGYRLYAVRELFPLLTTEPELVALLVPLATPVPHGIAFPRQRIIIFAVRDFFVSPGENAIGAFMPPAPAFLPPSASGNAPAFGDAPASPPPSVSLSGAPLSALSTLAVGGYVTHTHHGIGKYLGIQRLTANHQARDYFALQFADEVKMFIPPEQLHLVRPYHSLTARAPALDTIGGAQWKRRSADTRARIDRHAVHLLRLYAHRESQPGIAFRGSSDSEWQALLHQSFPFTETPAQLRCLREIFADMERPRPMNRLLCGDSGNGKTEVAIRAAAKCVCSAHQVILLAPTTVLAEQHYETFSDRLSSLPVAVALFTRMTSAGERTRLLAAFAAGTLDVIIATHRLLYEHIAPPNLGLLIVDEEHRFGVRAKEKIKSLNVRIDCLAISATPIPRSLQFALSQLHSISFLDDPPKNRKAIITKIHAHDPHRIADAIAFELRRRGQIYYLHNTIATIPAKLKEIQAQFPAIRITAIHGKMNPQQVDRQLHRFAHRHIDLLLATTIIENGIDIPTVNTIIVEDADMFGLSNLYQLRGRVGRAATQAYAYLFYNPHRAVNPAVRRRLQVIGDSDNHNTGLSIAFQDLEARGAGNVLGKQQSGDICAVGYETYIHMLDSAVRHLARPSDDPAEQSGDPALLTHDPYLELQYEGYLPDDYIPSMGEKLLTYQRIALAHTLSDIATLAQQLTIAYGQLPPEADILLRVAEIRILAQRLWITHLQQRRHLFRLHARKIARFNHNRLLAAMDDGRVLLTTERRYNLTLIPAPNLDADSDPHQSALYTALRTLLAELQFE